MVNESLMPIRNELFKVEVSRNPWNNGNMTETWFWEISYAVEKKSNNEQDVYYGMAIERNRNNTINWLKLEQFDYQDQLYKIIRHRMNR